MKHVSQFGLPKKRKQTLDILEKAFTEGNLDPHDYENRLDMVMQADSVEKLEGVLSDFPEHYSKQVSTTSSENIVDPNKVAPQNYDKLSLNVLGSKKLFINDVAKSPSRIFTILGEQRINFKDENLQHSKSDFEIVTVIGESSIDLRNKCLEGAVIRLRLTKIVGEVNIKVAPGTIVEDRTRRILGEYNHYFKSKSLKRKISKVFTGNQDDFKPVKYEKVNCHLILEGVCILGEVNVSVYDI